MTRRPSIACMAVVMAVAMGAAAAAQEAPAYGVSSLGVVVVDAWDMELLDNTTGWESSFNGNRYLTNGGGLLGSVHMPQGAEIVSIELDACDSSAAGSVAGTLRRFATGEAPANLVEVSTGMAEMPECGRFFGTPAAPETVDNAAYRYVFVVGNDPGDASTTLGGLRVYYKLQVSPAPATATFNDVPTSDPAFQFIEALVASGATAGCGSGNYCPDAPLTRRQMAVFLAKLLGLHWPEGELPD